MTIEKAVEILNANQHRGLADWCAQESDWLRPPVLVVGGTDMHENAFSPFEAVAVAEKYQSGEKDEQILI